MNTITRVSRAEPIDGRTRINLVFFKNLFTDHDDQDQDDYDSEDEFMYQYQDTARIEEVPAKEPVFNAVPLKSALKKRNGGSNATTSNSNPGTPMQEHQHAIGGGAASSSNVRLGRQGELK